jgi:hypothetical protein
MTVGAVKVEAGSGCDLGFIDMDYRRGVFVGVRTGPQAAGEQDDTQKHSGHALHIFCSSGAACAC